MAVKRHPELAVIAAAAMVRFGSRVLEDLVCRCQGVNELRFHNGKVRRDGLKTTLSDLRLAKGHRSARERWRRICTGPAVFVVSRERAKARLTLRREFVEDVIRAAEYAAQRSLDGRQQERLVGEFVRQVRVKP